MGYILVLVTEVRVLSGIAEHADLMIQAFEAIESPLNALCLHILDNLKDLPVWVAQNRKFEPDRDKAIFAFKHFLPTQGLTPQETFKCPGVIAGTEKTVRLVQAVNKAKEAFKQAVAECCPELHNKDRLIRTLLSRAGYPGLKLKQVFRHIPYLPYHPRRIAWTKTKHTSHKRITSAEAKKLLEKVGHGLHIQVQLAKLSVLNKNSMLVIKKEIKPGLMANITHFKQNNHSKIVDIRSSLPLIYLHDLTLPHPDVCFSKTIAQPLHPRADKQLEKQPFLPSIHAYRYKSIKD
jgi:hypothetical protein